MEKVFSDWRTRAHAPVPGTRLARFDEVPVENNGLEVQIGEGDRAFRVVLFRVGETVKAYVNECPHFHVPLNYHPGTFCVYEFDGQRELMCAHHTAMFRLDDGHCYDGPCVGDNLCSVAVTRVDDWVVVA